jgi:phosphatidylglycerophosphate synthase/choline kinase
VFKVSARSRLPLRILTIGLGTALFSYLVWKAGPGKLFADTLALRWGAMLILALSGCSHLAKTFAWALMLGAERQKVAFTRLFGLRLGAEAMGQLGIVGQTFGDSIRISHLGPEVSVSHAVSSVSLDRGFFFITSALLTIAGVVAGLVLFPLPHALYLYASVFAVVLCGFLFLTGLAVRRRWPVLSRATTSLGRLPFLRNWVAKHWCLIHSIEETLFDFHHQTPRLFWASFGLNLACQFLATAEVYVILLFTGPKIGFLAALVIEALTKLVNTVGNLNPGNIGTYEGGNVLIGRIFGLSTSAGLALGLSRRVRALFWAMVGGVCLFVTTRSNKERQDKSAPGTGDNGGSARLPMFPRKTSVQVPPLVVILFTRLNPDARTQVASPRVGSLPILLRAILSAQKAGAEQIVVVGSGRDTHTQRALEDTRRLPPSVRWMEQSPGTPLSQLFAGLQSKSDRLVLIEGNRTYHPKLFKLAAEWSLEDGGMAFVTEWSSEKGGVAFVTDEEAVGISMLPTSLVQKLSEQKVDSQAELHAWLGARNLLQTVPINEDQWSRIETPEDAMGAERKLDHWLVKPTDGFYAKMNRRMSIPISRQLIKFRLTPNMVSLVTLAVGFASGTLFAIGGYWHMLAGAILSLCASILDGCDGEVARLKLMESDFGCWLETICDYLYYLFLFMGMTLGLQRTSASQTYFIGGTVLFFGAVLSFLSVALQRHVLASERPEQLLQIWQGHVDSCRPGLILFLGRHTEFIVRRCFFPYALVVFALLDASRVAFWLSVVGANLVWPVALYSCFVFRRRHLSSMNSTGPRLALNQDS